MNDFGTRRRFLVGNFADAALGAPSARAGWERPKSQFSANHPPSNVKVLVLVGQNRRNQLREALDRLRKVNVDIIGVMLNGVPTKGRYSRYYGQYSYGSYSRNNESSESPIGGEGAKIGMPEDPHPGTRRSVSDSV